MANAIKSFEFAILSGQNRSSLVLHRINTSPLQMSGVPRDRTHIQDQILTLAAQHRTRSPGSCPGTKHSVVHLAKQGIPIPTRHSLHSTGMSIWGRIMMMQFGSAVHD